MTSTEPTILHSSFLDTQLGAMIAIADEKALYLLEFTDRRGLDRKIERLKKKTTSILMPGRTQPINSIEYELKQYFNGELEEFKTPVMVLGSLFQKQVWKELQKISSGQTKSYADIAAAIGKPSAFRAVAQANSANQCALIIPCHRVINANGNLGGYSGGLMRKQWLINHERKLDFITAL